MSVWEMLIVVLVALIVVKPEDLPVIIKKVQQSKSYFSNMKNQLLTYITENINIDPIFNENSPDQLNFYLKRIINMQGYYTGNYSLKDLKAKHNELIKLKSKDIL